MSEDYAEGYCERCARRRPVATEAGQTLCAPCRTAVEIEAESDDEDENPERFTAPKSIPDAPQVEPRPVLSRRSTSAAPLPLVRPTGPKPPTIMREKPAPEPDPVPPNLSELRIAGRTIRFVTNAPPPSEIVITPPPLNIRETVERAFDPEPPAGKSLLAHNVDSLLPAMAAMAEPQKPAAFITPPPLPHWAKKPEPKPSGDTPGNRALKAHVVAADKVPTGERPRLFFSFTRPGTILSDSKLKGRGLELADTRPDGLLVYHADHAAEVRLLASFGHTLFLDGHRTHKLA